MCTKRLYFILLFIYKFIYATSYIVICNAQLTANPIAVYKQHGLLYHIEMTIIYGVIHNEVGSQVHAAIEWRSIWKHNKHYQFSMHLINDRKVHVILTLGLKSIYTARTTEQLQCFVYQLYRCNSVFVFKVLASRCSQTHKATVST